jgi:hypothetical protein
MQSHDHKKALTEKSYNRLDPLTPFLPIYHWESFVLTPLALGKVILAKNVGK